VREDRARRRCRAFDAGEVGGVADHSERGQDLVSGSQPQPCRSCCGM